MKLNIKAFGLACGLFWGVGLFRRTWWIIFSEGSTPDLLVTGHLYRRYDVSTWASWSMAWWTPAWAGLFFAWGYIFLVGKKP